MSDSLNPIDQLIAKYLSGNASQDEIRELEEWKAASGNNLSVFQADAQAWENSADYLTEGALQTDRENIQAEIIKHQFTRIAKYRLLTSWLRIASVLIIPMLLAGAWYFWRPAGKDTPDNQYCTISSPKGNVARCTLPDGSEVWVNSGSTVKYNTALFNKDLRELSIEGEAYFEVAKDKSRPFRVITPAASIRVTGTSFNVRAYAEDQTIEAVLTEGSIEMKLNNKVSQLVKLVPGERAVYNTGEMEMVITKVNPHEYGSWRNGEVVFDNATLNDLLKELSRIYDIKFYLEDKDMGNTRFKGMFSYDSDLIDALEKIKRTSGIDYLIRNKEVWLSRER